MGALETLYELVYGQGTGETGDSDLLSGPKRMQLYALLKLMDETGKTGIPRFAKDVYNTEKDELGRAYNRTEWMRQHEDNPLTAGLSSSTYLRPAQSTIDERSARTEDNRAYIAKKIAEMKAARGIVDAEKSGEVAQRRGGSSYRAAEYVPESIARPSFDQIPVGGRKPAEATSATGATSDGFSDTDFGSLMRRYVADAEAEERAEAERRYNSVNIDIPGGYESLQRIRQQAGGKPGGGTLSVMGEGLTGGDTEEDLRRYVDEVRRNQTAIKIATIEASAPAKYRSPATNQYLDMLYKQKAEEEKSEVDAMNAAANMRQAQTEAEITGPALAKYHGEYNPAQIRVAELGVEEAKLRNQGAQAQDDRIYWGQVVDDLRMQAKDDPVLRANLPQIMAIIYDSTLSSDHKKLAVSQLMAKPVGDADAKLAEVDKKLWYTPGG